MEPRGARVRALAMAFGLLAALAGCANAADSECQACPTSSNAPVCGDDGIQYPNACVARCQGVIIAKDGPCSAPTTATTSQDHTTAATTAATTSPTSPVGQFMPEALRVTDGKAVSSEVMNKMAGEGYRFIGQFKLLEGAPTLLKNGGTSISPDKLSKKDPAGADSVQISVSMPEGYVYVQTAASKSKAPTGTATSSLGFEGDAATAAKINDFLPNTRRLKNIIGRDDRTFRAPTSYPARATLLLGFKEGTQNYLCSGSLISPSVILTAGHCVFTPGSGGGWHSNFVISSGAPSATGDPVRISVNVKTMTTQTRWTQNNDWKFDVAVLYLDKRIGDQLGWYGMTKDTCTSARVVPHFSTQGFPSDKRQGTMWGQNDCPIRSVDYTSCTNGDIMHECDIWPGQSGSPMYDRTTNKVHAVVSFQLTGGSGLNGAPYLGGTVWDMVYGAWSSTK